MSLDDQILTRALNLRKSERAELARQLLLSLEAPGFDADPQQAWADEIEARLERTDRSSAADWSTALQRIRASIVRNNKK